MTTMTGALRRRLRVRPAAVRVARREPVATASGTQEVPAVEIGDNDPLLAYLQSASGAVDLDVLELESPALDQLRTAGVRLAVPLVSQGELIGVLYLGPRRSEQEYSSDDRRLLDNLAAQAAPALRVGQLVRRQKAEAATRERFEAELEVARLIQQNFLPQHLPDLPGWAVAAHYQPAREVGGDFYDVIPLPDGQVGFVIGDVTDKGVPAALVMAATRSVLRASAQRLVEPAEVLERVNEHLCPDMPAKMFVTCLYGVLEPASGRFRFANAGHDLPYVKTATGSDELRARGMPLGLMTGMAYEQNETVLAPGDSLLLHSDGIVEAHDPQGRMYGFPRLKQVVATRPGGAELIDVVLQELAEHIGPGAEQEDDITMVVVQRSASADASSASALQLPAEEALGDDGAALLGEVLVPSAEGNERLAMHAVGDLVAGLGLAPDRLDRLRTAVAEATMNAMEHGSRYDAGSPVTVRVLATTDAVRVQVVDHGGGGPAVRRTEVPDLELKLAGLQRPRGWGLFLIANMVDEVRESTEGRRHVVELVVLLTEDGPGGDGDGHT